MAKQRHLPTWWGAPRKFDVPLDDRRISWLELFYDLVYVIAISRITHYLAQDISLHGLMVYSAYFVMIFWGWLNGSLYHDIHGNAGLRTRLMTLWQMMIIAALSITLEQHHDHQLVNSTIVFMIMQVFITYLWWSVGFYDREHRRYNMPYTILYLVALGLMGLSLVFPAWLYVIVPLVIICNYAPPFISHRRLRVHDVDLSLSPSMFERLGLLTIIVFGEMVLGVVIGIGEINNLDFNAWFNFALAISIVFSLWWIFFTLVANRTVKKGFDKATQLELLYIPTLIALGLIAVCFTLLFEMQAAGESMTQENGNVLDAILAVIGMFTMRHFFGLGLAAFLIGISLMMGLVVFHKPYDAIKRPLRISLYITALVFLVFCTLPFNMGSTTFLLGVQVILLVEMIYLNSIYFGVMPSEPENEGG